MNLTFKMGIVCFLIFLSSSLVFLQTKTDVSGRQSEYVGRYNLKPDLVLEVKKDGKLLKLLPSFWGSPIILDPIGVDKFASLLHPRMQFEFRRDNTGKVDTLVSTGNKEIAGTAQKLNSNEFRVVELLLTGQATEAKAKLKQPNEKRSEKRIVGLGFNLLRFRPSKAKSTLAFVSAFESEYPNSVDLQHVIGLASLMNNNYKKAKKSFRKALLIDSTNSMTLSAIQLLDSKNASSAPKDSWKLPFDINKLFKKPTKKEVDKVRKDWSSRDMSEKETAIVYEQETELNGRKYTIRIIRHTIQDRKHFGAVFIPKGSKSGNSPIVLELHGVNAKYSPFNILKAKMPKILGKNQLNSIIAIPSFRGNTLVLEDKTYISEGLPADAWDGAADDTIAFLNAVINKVPEADSARISAFGKSRGGTVALLVGVRDKRIGSVIDWAGPSGWFSNMGTFGWSLQQQVQWGLWEKWKPGRGWGSGSQFIDWFLAESIKSKKSSLKEVRHQILASSPIYFLDSLPVAQLHYGMNDGAVPISNAKALKEVLESRDKSAPKFVLYMHKDAGHDQPYPRAYELSRDFLLKQFSQ